jgi:hypothetical protein
VRADAAHELLLEGGARLARLAEPGGDDDEAPDALLGALVDDAEHLLSRHGEDGEVDLSGDVDDRSVRAHGLHPIGVGVDRMDGALESVRDEVVEDLAADRAAPPRGADDGDAARPKERVQGDRGHGDEFVSASVPRRPRLSSPP